MGLPRIYVVETIHSRHGARGRKAFIQAELENAATNESLRAESELVGGISFTPVHALGFTGLKSGRGCVISLTARISHLQSTC